MTFALIHLLALALLWALFHFTGDLALARSPSFAAVGPAVPLLRTALGLLLWMLLLFLSATLGLYRPLVVLPLAALLLAGGLALALRRGELKLPLRPEHGLQWPPRVRPRLHVERVLHDPRVLPALLAVAPAIVLLACFINTLSPQLGWDDDVYHLTLPRRYLEHGGFRPIPYSLYSHWPHGIQLVYGLGLMLQDQVLAKLLHTLFLLLLVLAVHRLCRSTASRLLSIAATLLLLGSPVVLFEAERAYIDLAFAFFFLLAIACADAFLRDERPPALVLCGLFCGGVAACKLSGLVAPACAAAVLLLSRPTGLRAGRALRVGLALGLPTLLIAGPWYLRSYLETGNPFYPMLYSHFGGIEWSERLGQQFFDWQRSIGMGRSFEDYLRLPLRVVLHATERYSGFDGRIGALWLGAVPLALLGALLTPTARHFAIGACLYFIVWAATSQQARFLIAALPLFAVAAATGAQALLARVPGARARPALEALLALAVLVQAASAFESPVERALVHARTLLERGPEALDSPTPPAYAHINQHTATDAKVLLLNVNRGFFLHRDYIADSAFEASQLEQLLAHASTPAQGKRLLADEGITHVYEGRPQRVAWPSWLGPLLRDRRSARRIYRDRHGGVYALLP